MTGDFDDLKFPVKWEIRVPLIHRARKKRKKKFLIFQLSKFSRENFSRIFEERSINNSSKVANIKKKKESRNVENDGRRNNRFAIYHSVPDFKHSSYTNTNSIDRAIRYVRDSCESIYIYINTVKLEILWKRGKWRKWIKRKKKNYRILN